MIRTYRYPLRPTQAQEAILNGWQSCGTVTPKPLGEREHRCPCGFVVHRDHAAALVIEGRGLRLGQLTEAAEVQ